MRETEIITYSLLGGASTHAWFVMTQLLGYPKVREYDRSWAEWGNPADLPVEQQLGCPKANRLMQTLMKKNVPSL
jgi:3-mercaptopyruvate sulfurtransferase SseA